MICPEFFGCSGKLDFSATRDLVRRAGAETIGDYSVSEAGTIAMSIDRIGECSREARIFAEIAVAHACRDLEAAIATPTDMLVCFEFEEGIEVERQGEIVRGIIAAAKDRNITLGKCHSVLVQGTTSLVVCVLGNRTKQSTQLPERGTVWLSHGLGASKLQYMAEIGTFSGSRFYLDMMRRAANTEALASRNCVLSDVSGHGLAGSLVDLAERHGAFINVIISPTIAIAQQVLTETISLFENDASSYGPLIQLDDRARSLAALKETAGPLVALCDSNDDCAIEASGWVRIGDFHKGKVGVRVRWAG